MRGQIKMGLVVLLLVVVAVIGWGVSTYNTLVRLHEGIPAAWSQVENMLQRRNDLIPNYVNTVKGFAKQEQEGLWRNFQSASILYAGPDDSG